MTTFTQNPFTVISPEKLSAEDAEQLFVEVFSDFPQVKNPGHAMITGARGSGKSMIFRCLLPDVIMQKDHLEFSSLPFVAFHIPIKNTQLHITDLKRVDDHHAATLINEHFLVVTVLIEILDALLKVQNKLVFEEESYSFFHNKVFLKRLKLCGCPNVPEFDADNISSCFENMHNCALELHAEFIRYILQISPNFDQPAPQYELPLLSFHSFLVPFLMGLKELPNFPQENIYLFIDDADNLSKTQTQVLNSWLATRTQPALSIKVSTQLGRYKTYLSTNGTLVEAPHDYQEINISDKYTTSKTTYYKRVHDIIEKRLRRANIELDPRDYFIDYAKQEAEIAKEYKRLLEAWEKEGRGNRATDDALRYARPNYIKGLGGTKKSRSTYMYAGFDQLVHLSSGIIRYFLDSAAAMFDETQKRYDLKSALKTIPYGIQDQIVREQAETKMFSQFQKLEADESVTYPSIPLGIVQKLQNLIFSMGDTFHEILVSDRSERRVFSIALSNMPDKEIKEVLDFGVQTGYLHMATIGNKEGTGRTWLYILNRSLAPQFVLDPTGFAGYLFVTNDALRRAMARRILLRDIKNLEEPEQLLLFD